MGRCFRDADNQTKVEKMRLHPLLRTACAANAALVAIGLLGNGSPELCFGDVALPADVRKALERNAARLSPITISWTLTPKETRYSQKETLSRLKLRRPVGSFFYTTESRVVWQGGKIHITREDPDVRDGAVVGTRLREDSFDGRILYGGSPGRKRPALFKRLLSRAIEEDPSAHLLSTGYFREAGFRLPRQVSEWVEARAESEPLYLLEHGGTLMSVEDALVDGERLIRVELVAPNPQKRFAEALDLEAEKKALESSKESPTRQRELLGSLQRTRALPDSRRFVYYLDPELHYAVRQWEQWYEPDTLLLRCRCLEFEELSGRGVWLPRRCEVDRYEFFTLPETVFEEPILSEHYEVSEFQLDSVPEETFVLNYATPGARIYDGTLPEAAENPNGYVRYTVPTSLDDLDRVIEMARAGEFDPGQLTPERSTGARALIVANVLLLGAIAAFFVWRKVRGVPGSR